MRILLTILLFAASLVADVKVSSPKISQHTSGNYKIEMLIAAKNKIGDSDFRLFEYKSNNPLTNDFITSTLLEDLDSFQRLTINLSNSYTADYFAYRIKLLDEFNKDIFIFLPDNPIKSARQALQTQNFVIPPSKKIALVEEEDFNNHQEDLKTDTTIGLSEPENILQDEVVSNIGTNSYSTRSGDTMWSISSSIRDEFEADIYQIMWGIFLNNPNAFIDGDISKLISNIDIEFPNKPFVESIDSKFAKESIRTFSTNSDQNSPRLTLSTPQVGEFFSAKSQEESITQDNSYHEKPAILNPTQSGQTPAEIIAANTSKLILNADLAQPKQIQVDNANSKDSILANILIALISLVIGFLLALVFVKRKGINSIEATRQYNEGTSLPVGLSIENNQEEQDLDLARTYIEMGSFTNAEAIIAAVINSSKDQTILDDAKTLLSKIKS
jgi:FimV-like protein